jgi:hypothetical protein
LEKKFLEASLDRNARRTNAKKNDEAVDESQIHLDSIALNCNLFANPWTRCGCDYLPNLNLLPTMNHNLVDEKNQKEESTKTIKPAVVADSSDTSIGRSTMLSSEPHTPVAAAHNGGSTGALNEMEENDILSDDGFVHWDVERTGMAQRIRVSQVIPTASSCFRTHSTSRLLGSAQPGGKKRTRNDFVATSDYLELISIFGITNLKQAPLHLFSFHSILSPVFFHISLILKRSPTPFSSTRPLQQASKSSA